MKNEEYLLITSYSFFENLGLINKFDFFSMYDSRKCFFELACKLKIMFWTECDIILVD